MSAGEPWEQRFDSVAAMARTLAADVAASVREAVARRGEAIVAVSGGRFSRHLFRCLSGERLPWASLTVVLADERWVAPGDPQSNERLVRDCLLRGPAAAARLIGLYSEGGDPVDVLPRVEFRLQQVPLPFDQVLLGMGDDGHTASLFPSAPADELDGAMRPSGGARVAVLHPSTSPVARVSLTLPTLLSARQVVLHIPGPVKHVTYRLAQGAGPESAMPVRAVLRQAAVPVNVLLCESEDP